MKQLAALITALQHRDTPRVQADALRTYFESADPRDVAWFLKLATKPLRQRPVKTATFRQAADNNNNNNNNNTPQNAAPPPPLHGLMLDHVQPLAGLNEARQIELLQQTLARLDTPAERAIYQKLVTGSFRIPAPVKLITETFARVVGCEHALIQTRLARPWPPNTEGYLALIAPAPAGDSLSIHPHGFAVPALLEPEGLAAEATVAELCGPIEQWHLEPFLDGVRCRLIRAHDRCLIWSAEDERLNRSFPELELLAQSLPPGTVLEGTILAWENERPLPYDRLQDRLGQTQSATLFATNAPVAFFAADLLQVAGETVSDAPFARRRRLLETLVANTGEALLKLAPQHPPTTWPQAANLNTAGLHLKHLDRPYQSGLQPGAWWFWPGGAHRIDALLMRAESAEGPGRSTCMQYTFGVWHGENPVAVARTDAGLGDARRAALDDWIVQHAKARPNGVYELEPIQVFTLGFIGVAKSKRSPGGYTLRHPRIVEQQPATPPQQADRLIAIQRLYQQAAASG